MEYAALLEKIQQKQRALFWQVNAGASQKTNAVLAIQRYLLDTDSTVENMSSEDLISRLYNDIFAYSILSDPLDNIWITKISVEAWNDVRVLFWDGKACKIGGFANQQQADGTIDRLLADSGLKTGIPYLCGKLKSPDAKITVFRPPSTSNGMRCFIEKPVKRAFTIKDYLSEGFAAKGELDLIDTALQYGVSILVTGPPGSGKTTFIKYLVDSFPERISAFVLESGKREIESDKELLLSEKDQEKFISDANGAGCDILAFNFCSWLSLKAAESLPAVVAQSTGNNPACGIQNMADNITQHCRCNYSQAALRICAAFPLVVYLGKHADQKRRIISISEPAFENGRIVLTPIWQFQANSMDTDDFGARFSGHHEQTGEISVALLEQMKLHGITPEKIQNIKRREKTCLKEGQSAGS